MFLKGKYLFKGVANVGRYFIQEHLKGGAWRGNFDGFKKNR